MRTALVLLFLLALGALPGALLPQRPLNPPKVDAYIAGHGWWGRLLDALQFYNVYSSVWFSAIYVLLFVSLVGCLLPRSLEYTKAIRAAPVRTPSNLTRLPHHAKSTVDGELTVVAGAVRGRLRGWRIAEHEEADGGRAISAERGYLRETGNLVFHFAMLGLIVAFALGAMYKYSGQVIVQATGGDDAQFCNAGVYNYDSFTPGLRVDGTNLNPFCVKVNDFTAHYQPSGEADHYDSHVEYQSGKDLDTGTWRPYDLKVNSPLRTAGDRIYLLGHGYTPVFTVTFPNGQRRAGATQWKPDDPNTMLSEGATTFDPPGITDPGEQRKKQLAITGLFAPTALFDGALLSSAYPAAWNPAVAVDIYQGDLGTGGNHSIFSVDERMVHDGRLNRMARVNLIQGQQTVLPDGTVIRFDHVQQWVSLMVAHDPTQDWVLAFAVCMLLGLGVSLTIKRRRLWVRLTPAGGEGPVARTVVEVGGLARTDQAGYGEEFTRIAADLHGKGN